MMIMRVVGEVVAHTWSMRVLTGARSCNHRATRRSTSQPNTSITALGLGLGLGPRVIPKPRLVVFAVGPGLGVYALMQGLEVVMAPRACRARDTERGVVVLSVEDDSAAASASSCRNHKKSEGDKGEGESSGKCDDGG